MYRTDLPVILIDKIIFDILKHIFTVLRTLRPAVGKIFERIFKCKQMIDHSFIEIIPHKFIDPSTVYLYAAIVAAIFSACLVISVSLNSRTYPI